MKKHLLAAACSLSLDSNTSKQLVLIPEGKFQGVDGRPNDSEYWTLSKENGQAIVAALNQIKTDMVIDWEHATLMAKENGTPAPAAGWCKAGKFEYVQGLGVCSNDWSWTPRASQQIADQEYKYLSPVFVHTKDGEVLGLLHAALTNTPCLDTLPEVMLAAATKKISALQLPQANEDPSVDLIKKMLAALKLPDDATEDQVMSALSTLQTAAASSQTPDPAKYVPVAVFNELQAENTQLREKTESNGVEPLIQAALSDGRLKEGSALLGWARDLGKSNPAALKEYLDKAPKVAALTARQSTSVHTAAASRQDGDLTAEALAVAKQMGNTPEFLKKHGGEA